MREETTSAFLSCFCSLVWPASAGSAGGTRWAWSACCADFQAAAGERDVSSPIGGYRELGCFRPTGCAGWRILRREGTAQSLKWRTRRRRRRDVVAGWGVGPSEACHHPSEIKQERGSVEIHEINRGFVFVTFKASPQSHAVRRTPNTQRKERNGLSLHRPTMGCLETSSQETKLKG